MELLKLDSWTAPCIPFTNFNVFDCRRFFGKKSRAVLKYSVTAFCPFCHNICESTRAPKLQNFSEIKLGVFNVTFYLGQNIETQQVFFFYFLRLSVVIFAENNSPKYLPVHRLKISGSNLINYFYEQFHFQCEQFSTKSTNFIFCIF